MFVTVWLAFLASGVAMAIIAIVWAVRSRQFEDQDRARYLPLAGLSDQELNSPPPARRSPDLWGNLAIVVGGALVLVITLIIVVQNV